MLQNLENTLEIHKMPLGRTHKNLKKNSENYSSKIQKIIQKIWKDTTQNTGSWRQNHFFISDTMKVAAAEMVRSP